MLVLDQSALRLRLGDPDFGLMMRMLVVAPQPFFTPRGTPLSVYYRALVSARLGAEVDVLTYGEGEDVDIPGVRIVRIPRLRSLGSVPIGPSFLKLVLDQFMILWTVGLLIRNRYRVVHAHEEAVFWCRFLKPIFRFKLVYDMHSSLPQQLTNFRFTTSRLLIWAFEVLERTCLRNADAIITICPDLQDYALRTGVHPDRHVLIENSLFEHVRLKGSAGNGSGAEAANGSIRLKKESDGPLIVYTGTFEAYQGLDLLVRAFAAVSRSRPDAHLLVIGGTPAQVAALEELAEEVGLNGRCTFMGRVSRPEAVAYNQAAHVLVSPRRSGMNTPLKIYEQLASGKPLVATRIRAHTQVLTDDVSFLVDPDPDSIARGILDAIGDARRRRRVVERALSLYEGRYARSAYEAKMRRLLEMVR